MIFAASTMLLFAACNKEENNGYTINGDKITFGLSMDDPQDQGKQAFYGRYKIVYFTEGDQIYVNNTPCNVMPQADPDWTGTTNAFSPYARVTADVSATGRYDFIYPAAVLQYDGTNYGATFPSMIQALSGYNNNMLDETLIRLEGDELPIWPMYYGIDDLNNVSGQIVLKNACAFLSPNFTYGPNWANKVFKPITGVQYGEDIACPDMNIYDGRIKSNIKLYGDAVLDYTNMNNPLMVVTDNMPAGGYQVLRFTSPQGSTITESVSNNEILNVAGLIPIAPFEDSTTTKSFQMAFSFYLTLDVLNADSTVTPTMYYLCFISDTNTTIRPIYRNHRYWMEINFQTLGNTTVTYEDGLENYTTNKGGLIHFGNGDLYVTSNLQNFRDFVDTYGLTE